MKNMEQTQNKIFVRNNWLTRYSTVKPRVPLQVKIWRGEQPTVPEGIARLAYEEYSRRFGTDQPFERIHERGGFGHNEIIALLADRLELYMEQTNIDRVYMNGWCFLPVKVYTDRIHLIPCGKPKDHEGDCEIINKINWDKHICSRSGCDRHEEF